MMILILILIRKARHSRRWACCKWCPYGLDVQRLDEAEMRVGMALTGPWDGCDDARRGSSALTAG